MSVTTLISEDEYLRTSYPDLDCEFCDGEVIERAMPTSLHSETQELVSGFFLILRRHRGIPIYARPELRTKMRPAKYRIPDVSVYWPAKPRNPIPEIRALVAIEIMSSDDTLEGLSRKLREYLDLGIPHVWLVDPITRLFYAYDHRGLHRVPDYPLPEIGVTVQPSDFFEA